MKPSLQELNYVLKSLVDYQLLKVDSDKFYNFYQAVNEGNVQSAIHLIKDSKFQTWSYKTTSIDFKHNESEFRKHFETILDNRENYWVMLSDFFPELSDKFHWVRKFVEDQDNKSLLIFLKSVNKHPEVEHLLSGILDNNLQGGLNWLKSEFTQESIFNDIDRLIYLFPDVDWREVIKESRLRYVLKLAEKLNKSGAELGETWIVNDPTGFDTWIISKAVDQESILNLNVVPDNEQVVDVCNQLMSNRTRYSIIDKSFLDYNLGPDSIINLDCDQSTFEDWQEKIKRGTLLVLRSQSKDNFSIKEKLKASDIVFYEAFDDLGSNNEILIAVK